VARRRTVKTAAKEGGGPPPGYRWSIQIFDSAYDEGESLLTKDQMLHIRQQLRDLARHDEPSRSNTLSIDKIEDFYELREKGGILGKMNVRVFFGVNNSEREIVVLGVVKKENNGPTPIGDKVRMRYRWRKYQTGKVS